MGKKKVFVSGCYDMLHSGHVAFFEEAATHGDLYVGIGSDKTIHELKARKTIHTEDERLLLRRPSWGGEDLFGALHRGFPEPALRQRLPGGRPGRGRDPWTPPNLYRLPPGPDHPEAGEGGQLQSRRPAGRDRQAGERFPGRPGLRSPASFEQGSCFGKRTEPLLH